MQRWRRSARSVITDFVEGGDDLLLGDICHFHFALLWSCAYLCSVEF